MWGYAWPSAAFEWRPVSSVAALPVTPVRLHHQVLDRRDPRLLRHVLSRAQR